MSKTPTAPPTSSTPPTSVWSKGPPAAGDAAPGAAEQPRKGAMMVGAGVDIKKGAIAFGSVDSPNGVLSSSPAAPSITGTHLADTTVKSFGSIAADSADPDSVKPPSRRTSQLVSPTPSNGQLKKAAPDMHAFFGKPNGQGNGQPYMPGPNMRPPQNMPYNAQGSQMHGFRPQQQQGGMPPQMQAGMQRMMRPPQAYGMPGQQYPVYPGQGYYVSGFDLTWLNNQGGYMPEQQYGLNPQWAPPSHPGAQGNYGMSPRGTGNQPLPSPGTTGPSSAGPSPGATPSIRPPSLVSGNSSSSVGQLPSTPGRPSGLQPGATFTPGQQPNFTPGSRTLNPGTAVFTPPASKAIKFARPDGTSVNIKEVAAAAKGPAPAASPAPAPAAEPVPEKKKPSLPVIVRIESEDQKKARLQELAQEERKRKPKEEEDKKVKEAQEAKDAEERAAKEAADAEEKRKRDEQEVEAAKKAEEERKVAEEEQKKKSDAAAAATPGGSAAPSIVASPTTAEKSLPPKPTGQRPAALDLKSSSKAGPSALHTAKPIGNLKEISYPEAYKAPREELLEDSQVTQFRYDIDFLLQFMSLCREKPEGFPALADVGMEPDSHGGAGGAGRGGRGGRGGGMGPPGRGGANMGRPGMGQGMGSFNMGMGQFGAGSAMPKTSEERLAQSNSRMMAGGMGGRVPSQGGPGGLPPMHVSRSGNNRSQRGTRRPPQQAPAFNDPSVAPLTISTNSWVKARPTDTDEKSPAFIERKVKALLNKLTEEKFESISNQILEWANKSRDETDGMTLKLVIKQIFEKATDEAHWSSMYAKLCRKLLDRLDPEVTEEETEGKKTSGGNLFRKYLVGRCQMDFEAGWKAREDAATAAQAKSDEDKAKQAQHEKDKADGKETEEIVMLSDEYYAAQKAKRRGLGLVQLIGELYKLDMINNRVIKSCLKRLMINVTDPDEEDLESTCRLISTVGKQLEDRSPEDIDIVFQRLDVILEIESLPSRIRFMILDLKDLRRAGWKSRNKQTGVMTIAEVHQQAAKEQAEKTAAANRESMSRGGSRAGHQRRDGPRPGEWQPVANNARPPPQRPADLSNLGRNLGTARMASAPNFGPASVFQNRRNQAGGATPPLSRQASTANMFNVLGEGSEPSAPAAAPATQRKKLKLKPRTKPVEGEAEEGEVQEGEDDEEDDEAEEDDEDENEEDEDDEEEEEEEAAPAAATGMTETAAKAKIESDMKELWGEKDAGGSRNVDDIVEYYQALPDERKSLLSERLADDVFRIAKLRDAELVARGWSTALEKGAASKEALQKGIEIHMPTLDDDAIDFPQAYKAVAMLMRSLSLSEDEIKALLEKVDVYGTPRITPTDKLNKAFTQLDEEEAKA